MDSENVRQARAYAAWIFLVAAAVEIALGAWALSGLPGGPFPQDTPGSLTGSALWLRGEAAAPYLLQITVTALPVAAVLLAAIGGRPVGTARQVTVTAVTIQTVALVLGMVACVVAPKLPLGGRLLGGRHRRRGGRADPDQRSPSLARRGPADAAEGWHPPAVMARVP
jgi:hypothetical protein